MERYNENNIDGPSWKDEVVRFFLVMASCVAMAYGIFQFAQFLGWIPDLWWLS